MDNRQADVIAAFLQPGDTIVHPKTCGPAVVHHIDHYPATEMLHFFFNDEKVPSCKLKNSTRVTMLGLSSMS